MLKEPAEVRLNIGSRFEDLDLVDTVSAAVLEHVHVVGDHLEHTSLAIREAAANGIEHGNGEGSNKRVDISIRIDGDLLTVVVRDEGEGFDPEKVDDPLAPENLLKPRGRGIFLTRRFMDSIEYSYDGGTVLTMTKKLEEPPADSSPGRP